MGSELLWTEAGHSRLPLQCVQSPVPGEGVIVGKDCRVFQRGKGPGMSSGEWELRWPFLWAPMELGPWQGPTVWDGNARSAAN